MQEVGQSATLKCISLLRNKRFLVNFYPLEKYFKICNMFMEKEIPCSFFHFSFRATLNTLVYVDIDWGIYKVKLRNPLNGKRNL